MESPHELLEVVNDGLEHDQRYSLALSPRFGSTASKEAYAYYYRAALLSVARTFVPEGDFPERPPFGAEWVLWTG